MDSIYELKIKIKIFSLWNLINIVRILIFSIRLIV